MLEKRLKTVGGGSVDAGSPSLKRGVNGTYGISGVTTS